MRDYVSWGVFEPLPPQNSTPVRRVAKAVEQAQDVTSGAPCRKCQSLPWASEEEDWRERQIKVIIETILKG